MDIKIDKYKDRIRILAWAPASYDHDDGFYEIAHIKMSKSKNSYMDDWNLDELLGNIQVRDRMAELIAKRDKKIASRVHQYESNKVKHQSTNEKPRETGEEGTSRRFKVIGKTWFGHKFEVGQIVELIKVYPDGVYEVLGKGSPSEIVQDVHPSDLEELIEEDRIWAM